MERNLKLWQILGIILTIIFGTLLHFVFEWSGNNLLVGIFGAVNESSWEHLKLLFWPMLIYGLVEYFFSGKKYANYFPALTIGLLTGMIFILAFFYTYTGIIGEHFLWLDILSFILGAIVAFRSSYKVIKSGKFNGGIGKTFWIFILIILIACFIFFTTSPPHIALFKDPISGTYGIQL